MAIDATFWVAVSFILFFGGLTYLKVPQKINEILNKLITEIDTLMKLLVSSLKDEFEELNKNNIKLNTIGNINNLPNKVQKELNYVENKTSENNGLVLTLAVSYGAKEEITKN